MDFSSLDIAQLSIPDGISVVKISLHQHENKKKKCKDKKKKQPKAYRSVIRVHFRIAPLLEIRMKEKEFSGQTDDVISTAQAIIGEIEIPKIVITDSEDTIFSSKRFRSAENSSSFSVKKKTKKGGSRRNAGHPKTNESNKKQKTKRRRMKKKTKNLRE